MNRLVLQSGLTIGLGKLLAFAAAGGAAAFVMGVNGGNQTVPTVRFDDGSALTNPSIVGI